MQRHDELAFCVEGLGRNRLDWTVSFDDVSLHGGDDDGGDDDDDDGMFLLLGTMTWYYILLPPWSTRLVGRGIDPRWLEDSGGAKSKNFSPAQSPGCQESNPRRALKLWLRPQG